MITGKGTIGRERGRPARNVYLSNAGKLPALPGTIIARISLNCDRGRSRSQLNVSA